jgi:hypothetical protein
VVACVVRLKQPRHLRGLGEILKHESGPQRSLELFLLPSNRGAVSLALQCLFGKEGWNVFVCCALYCSYHLVLRHTRHQMLQTTNTK